MTSWHQRTTCRAREAAAVEVAPEATQRELREAKTKFANLTARAATADAAQLAAGEERGAARAEVLPLISFGMRASQ